MKAAILIKVKCMLSKTDYDNLRESLEDYTKGNMFWHPATFSRCFSCKTAFLKWIFEADPVGVQIRAVSHFNGLEETFKMR